MFDQLLAQNFEVDFRSHAKAILGADFPEVAVQLEEVLLAATIPIEEIIGSGGGEAKGTQRLRKTLKQRGWRKHNFNVQRIIDGVQREAQSHEIDHIRTFERGTVALEIEWNNKDPFFDLENFKRLHADGAISLGIIITRGAGLQAAMRSLVARFADEKQIDSHADLERIGLSPTNARKTPFPSGMLGSTISLATSSARPRRTGASLRIASGAASVTRGPLVLIGLPASIVTFGENPAVVEQLLIEGEKASGQDVDT